MFETYRMLGEQRESELLREARRLHAGQSVRRGTSVRMPQRRFRALFGSSAFALLTRLRLRGSTPPLPEIPEVEGSQSRPVF
jgi:hypothetical protein